MADRECWCGCQQVVDQDRHFVVGHDKRAEAAVIQLEYGTVAKFVEDHGYGPEGRNIQEAMAARKVDLNPRGGGQYKTRRLQNPQVAVGRIADPPPSGWSVAWETLEGAPGESRWRATKMADHPDPRFSPATPWMLERVEGEQRTIIDFIDKSDPPFQIAAALDGLREMPKGYRVREL